MNAVLAIIAVMLVKEAYKEFLVNNVQKGFKLMPDGKNGRQKNIKFRYAR